MQSLTEQDEIDRVLGNRRLLEIAQPVFEIVDSMLSSELGAEFDHLWRIIDRYDFARVSSQELRKGAFPGAEIGNGQAGNQRDQRVRESFPGTARHITASEFSSKLIEILPGFVVSFA